MEALEPILEQRWSPSEQRQAIEAELASLARTAQIKLVKRAAFALTTSGKHACLTALGIDALPAKVKWQTVKRKYLLARALGLPAPATPAAARRFEKSEGMSAAILARHHRLGIGDYPTLKHAKDALAWRALGVESGKPFTLKAVHQLLLSRSFGVAQTQEPDKALAQLAAKTVAARRAETGAIQLAALHRWLDDPEATSDPENRQDETLGSSAVQVAVPSDDDGAFAARVLEAARGSRTGQFGDNKVFISHVFKQIVADGAAVGTLEAFKERLVSVHLDGLLSLSRADLVEAMAAEDVSASETLHGASTFHFVRIHE